MEWPDRKMCCWLEGCGSAKVLKGERVSTLGSRNVHWGSLQMELWGFEMSSRNRMSMEWPLLFCGSTWVEMAPAAIERPQLSGGKCLYTPIGILRTRWHCDDAVVERKWMPHDSRDKCQGGSNRKIGGTEMAAWEWVCLGFPNNRRSKENQRWWNVAMVKWEWMAGCLDSTWKFIWLVKWNINTPNNKVQWNFQIRRNTGWL